MQMACFFVLFIIGIHSIKDGKNVACSKIFDVMFAVGEFAVIFDGLTAWSINNQDVVSLRLNLVFHFFFFFFLVLFMYLQFCYFLEITFGISKKTWKRICLCVPFLIIFLLILLSMKSLKFIQGKTTFYSMGFPVYVCFSSVLFTYTGSFLILFTGKKYIEKDKQRIIIISSFIGFFFMLLQAFIPEVLTSSLAVSLVLVAFYTNLENPSYKRQKTANANMVENFSTLIDNRDDSTGGHVRRTTLYVNLIMKAMLKSEKYKNVLTRDFMNNMLQASPMHDIGKISVPDSILQAPRKLTEEEFSVMKTHTIRGGDIIQETFGHNCENKDFVEIAYEVCQFHHEKWNGHGYPEELAGEEIPLCARIMSVADVFDAVSAKRCYRDAMPLNQCFEIIEKGKGTDFDPDITEIFLSIRPQVEEIYFESFPDKKN